LTITNRRKTELFAITDRDNMYVRQELLNNQRNECCDGMHTFH